MNLLKPAETDSRHATSHLQKLTLPNNVKSELSHADSVAVLPTVPYLRGTLVETPELYSTVLYCYASLGNYFQLQI